MSRYRPPQAPSSPHITRQGYERLEEEQKALWARRKDVTAALSAAAAEGDRSENAEYIYRKKELREIDRRIRYLQKRIPNLNVIDRRAAGDAIFFGAQVELEVEQVGGQPVAGGVGRGGATEPGSLTIRIVGADEIDPQKKHISIDSPLARALLKKKVDDEVALSVEGKQLFYTVIGVSYPE